MKYRIFLVTSIIIILVAILLPRACAHSGKTDSNGGHYDRSTGEYHYHHGYSAHQHYDGECPYDFDDKTNHNSGSSSNNSSSSNSSSNNSSSNNSSTNSSITKHTKDTITFGEVIKKIFLFSLFFFGTFFVILAPYIYGFFENKKVVTIILITLCIIGTTLMTIFIK